MSIGHFRTTAVIGEFAITPARIGALKSAFVNQAVTACD